MKLRNVLLASVIMTAGLVSCKKDHTPNDGFKEGTPTYTNISIMLPTKMIGKATGDDNISNNYGTYEGNDIIKTLDLYLQSANGDIQAEHFTQDDIAVAHDANGGVSTVSPNEPILTTSGTKTLYVVLNDTDYIGADFGPGTENEFIDTEGMAVIEAGKDVILMTVKQPNVVIDPDVTMQQAAAGTANKLTVGVIRAASRVIVTHEITDLNFDAGNGNTGKFTALEFSVAQSAKKVYWLPQTGVNTLNSYGYDYIPQINVIEGDVPYVGADGAIMYYDYSDLETPSEIPSKPGAADEFMELEGKFLYETTHKRDSDPELSGYRKGNTPYILVKATFLPDPAAVADGGPLTNGTFYYGMTDNKIYSSKAAADIGVENQKVRTYRNGKMLYFAWLNPNSISKPAYSPVVRNNIYHINIKSIGSMGQTWNPLYPEDPDTVSPQNPDPKPGPEEPKNPIDPYHPLSMEETYMTLDISVLDWVVNSYDIDF